jgi:SAM-dependent methyltransferase
MKLADPDHVAEQYQDSTRFDARVRIYELYDVSPEPWIRWLFDRLALTPGERVLEVGCGTGNLWRENASRVPERVALVLSDLSPGMLGEARARLAGLPLSPELCEADAQALPFSDESFDLVIANHMLYHVPDRARALGEVRRVLRRGGRFVAGTNHWTHLIELRELLTRFGVAGSLLRPHRDSDGFDLETAAEEISSVLDVLGVDRRLSALEIRDVEPLIAYVRSMADDARAASPALAALRACVARQIALMGAFHVGIAAGIVKARKPA